MYSRRRTIAGSTRKVKRGSSRDFPVYSYAPVQRKLVHVTPLVTTVQTLYINRADNQATYPWIAPLGLVPEGSGIDARKGNRILMRSLILNTAFSQSNATNNHHLRLRLSVVYDSDPTGVVPGVSDIFDSYDPLTFPRLETRTRFQILYLREVDMENMSVINSSNAILYSPGVGTEPHFRVDIPINRSMVYKPSAGTATLADITRGALYLCVSAFDLAGAGNAQLRYSHRITFDDIS